MSDDPLARDLLAGFAATARRAWWLPLLVVAATVGGALAALAMRDAVYEGRAFVLASPVPRDDSSFVGLDVLRDTGEPVRTMQTAATLLETSGRAVTPERVREAVRVENVGESAVLAVVAEDADPARATALANTYAEAAVAERARVLRAQVERRLTSLEARIEGGGTLSPAAAEQVGQLKLLLDTGVDPSLTVSNQATPPAASTGTRSSVVLTVAVVCGLALGLLLLLVLHLATRRARDREDPAAAPSRPVLAGVPPPPPAEEPAEVAAAAAPGARRGRRRWAR